MTTETIRQMVLRHLDGCPAGLYCFFIRLNSLQGVKCYPDKQARDDAHRRQGECYDAGYGPKTLGVVDFPVDWYDYDEDQQIDHFYCYYTELIDPCVPYGDESRCAIFEYNYGKDIDLLREQIRDVTGWYPDDPHGYNWGWNDGKLQLLDFV